MKEPDEYEMQQIAAIAAWKREEPGVASQALGLVIEPLAWLVQTIVPEAAVRGAIDAASTLGQWMTDSRDVLRDAQVPDLRSLRGKDLRLSDQLADYAHNWAVGVAVTEGAATGFLGILGAPVDVPAIITIAMRTIHKIGLCYGYECESDEDREFACSILSAAGANSLDEKLAALAALSALRTTLTRQTWKLMAEKAAQSQVSKEAVLLVMRNLAKQVGINLTKRRALAAIPWIGALVGGSVNGWYIKELGWAARRSFQERWLIDAGKLDPDPEAE